MGHMFFCFFLNLRYVIAPFRYLSRPLISAALAPALTRSILIVVVVARAGLFTVRQIREWATYVFIYLFLICATSSPPFVTSAAPSSVLRWRRLLGCSIMTKIIITIILVNIVITIISGPYNQKNIFMQI